MMEIKLGNIDITRIEEMFIPFPAEIFVPDQALLADNESWLAPQFYNPDEHSFTLNFCSWLLQVDDRIIVIDPCNGNDRTRAVFPFFDHINTPFIERFCATGVRPEEVDFVFCTHLHNDHCGWNTRLHNGRWTPTFPNARYLFVQREYERWDPALPNHQKVDYNVGVFEDSILPVINAGLVDFVEEGHFITPSLRIDAAYGHTIGHSMLHLSHKDAKAYFVGDVFHNPIEIVAPTVGYTDVDDLSLLIETRQRVCALCADEGAMLIPAHFAAPHAGWIKRTGHSFRFETLNL